ncbi:MAG: acyl-CoA thioesterase [Bacteroidales bacterium]|jgi:acyl-CoA thioester hydrolase|nr:acyl-CoA thioesterase [Bacteroidales bacterium]MDD2686964.1 acyl-CoA thioesterase [Bacteroidales bacterium]MDD3330113.1 acyl-CoA thioesterase [Bacteroidales bacterium]MDD3690876.1 acyl-CoA thioesterase [Bacteroidales bacterium]MDD4044676.1 acyl-CoA thioesterase [Bacteroidales bacterium]
METSNYVFKHRYPVQVRMTDLDPVGHVNNGVQLSYYDMGRLNYLEIIQQKKIVWEDIDMVVVHISCDFMNSIYFHDNIFVETKVLEIGNKSVKMIQRIVNSETNEIKSSCYSVMAGYDKMNNCSKPIPELFKQSVSLFENFEKKN